MAPAPRQLELQAGELAVGALAWGPEDGPLAIALHGYPDTAWTWRHVGPRLADAGYHVVAPFLRGYAPTALAPDGSYEVGALVRDVVETHAALGGDGRTTLIGHDWGALTAYAAASFAPGLFRRVVTLACPPPAALAATVRSPTALRSVLPLIPAQARMSRYLLLQQVPIVSERAFATLVPRLWAQWSPGYDAGEDLSRLSAALDLPVRQTAALRYTRSLVQPWYRSRAYRAEHARLRSVPDCPVLYLHGRRDGCIAPSLVELLQLPAGMQLGLVEGAGHFLQLERPEEVAERIAAFLAG